ncbi:KRAB-A domain-containing protein 2-like isoform X1 [Macrobrachium rosenbergii]|uniref:KRAB-A domain-containing protein 2-like isoform X1 n=1 Tax=Macrobrachium rosenbergii TaxID=79674 RepID=UPI0034D5CC7F
MTEESVVSGQESRYADMRQHFYKELFQVRANAAKNCVFLTEATYEKLVNDVKNAKSNKKEPRDYWLLKRYDVMVVENRSKLIYPVKEGVSAIRFYVRDSELFDVLHDTHLAIGHGGRDRMLKELSPKYKNITRHDIELYIRLCEPCQKKQKGVKKGVVVTGGESHAEDNLDLAFDMEGDGTQHSVDSQKSTNIRENSSPVDPIAIKRPRKQITDVDEECETFGRHVAVQLKQLPTTQRILAQDELQKVLTRYRLAAINGGPAASPQPSASDNYYSDPLTIVKEEVDET